MVVNIIEFIENKRQEMVNLGEELGLSSEKTIICSQELDELINLIGNIKLK